jgi:hypothetical protein
MCPVYSVKDLPDFYLGEINFNCKIIHRRPEHSERSTADWQLRAAGGEDLILRGRSRVVKRPCTL